MPTKAIVTTTRPASVHQRRADRFASLRALWDVTRLDRLRGCSRWLVNAGDGVPVVQSGDGCHLANLQRCASIWACPCCSAKIRSRRSDDIEKAANLHRAAGGTVVMVTLTVKHSRDQTLALLLGAVAGAWRGLLAGRAAKDFRQAHGVVGFVRAIEITHGEHGWHPHLHVLFFLEGEADEARCHRLERELTRRWLDQVEAHGLARPLDGVAVRLSVGDVASYVAKVQDDESARSLALEVTRHDLKEGRRHGRTPFQILRDFRQTGDVADLVRWWEYERATFGRRAITWSVGLRARFPELGAEATDDEVAEGPEGGTVLAVIPPTTWAELVKLPAGPAVVLTAAEDGGVKGLVLALRLLGLPGVVEVPPPPPPPGPPPPWA